jgi:hypothetical protein
MSGISIVLLIAGLVAGMRLVKLKTSWVVAFVVIETLILLNGIAPGFLWLHPRLGESVAAASGISGGAVFHVVTLFPIWGSVTAVISARRIRRGQAAAGV